ncbi:MAG: alpha/beta hydrolase [Phycisphaeraceae bacterium]|nr:MAG: alpha/beta hydrolase [Phycisphaeraceae bacterium]
MLNKRVLCWSLVSILTGGAMAQTPPPGSPPPDSPPTRPPSDRPPADQPPVEREPQRPGVRQSGEPLRLLPNVEQVRDVVYATVRTDAGRDLDLHMNVYFPKDSAGRKLPVVIYIHGGGFTGGSREAGDQLSAIVAAGGYFACTIQYRLLQQGRFPAAMHDCKAAVRFLRANAEELGIDPKKIGVWGHSAGGHLAAYLGVTGNAPETHGDVGETPEVDSSVACVIDYFGPTDFPSLFTGRGRDIQRLRTQLFGEAVEDIETKLRRASPVHWVDADDPPVLIVHGSQDNLVPLSQSEIFEKALHEAGVKAELIVVEGAGHGFRDADSTIRCAEFFDRHLGGALAPVVTRIAEATGDDGPLGRRGGQQARPQRPGQPPADGTDRPPATDEGRTTPPRRPGGGGNAGGGR